MTGSCFLYSDFADPEQGAAVYEGGSPPGGYSPAAALTGYALANVLHHDPFTVVKLDGANAVLDVDLGQARVIGAVALLNVSSDGAIPAVNVWSSTDDTTWLDHGQLFDAAGWSGVRNRVAALPAGYERRYWRLQVTTATDWTIGKLMLGKWFELGDWYSPGAFRETARPQTVNRTAADTPIVHVFGSARERFELPFNDAAQDLADVAVALSREAKPFVYVWPDDGVARHVFLEEPVRPVRSTAVDPVWALRLAMEAYPT